MATANFTTKPPMLDDEIQDMGNTMLAPQEESRTESESTIIDKGLNKLHHDHRFYA
jgi:hypothetical protein